MAIHLGLVWLAAIALDLSAGERDPLPSFEFTNPTDLRGWQPTHDIARLEPSAEGLVIHIAGGDPYMVGPIRNYSSGPLLWLHVRLKSDEGGTAQIFYFTDAPTEARSVRIAVPPGVWHEGVVPLPPLGANYRLRIDPPGTGGVCVLGRLWFEERVVFAAPAWPKPQVPQMGEKPLAIGSGELRLVHNRREIGGFSVEVDGRSMAIGQTEPLISYVVRDQVRWVSLRSSNLRSFKVEETERGLSLRADWSDPDGGEWSLAQAFASSTAGAIAVESSIRVDRERAVLYLPLLTLLPGVGAYGTNKNQGLFAGVEYLENEPSSSEADLTEPAAWRLAPDTLKVTSPLMAIQADGRYVGLTWKPREDLCAVYDSPDRQFNSGGHLMGLVFPGSDGANREERSLLPYRPKRVPANQPLTVRATLIGGRGDSIVPAVQHYVRLAGLPPLPDTGYAPPTYFELASKGWLESRIREGDLYRHAYWPGFNAQPAADAALWMKWLALQVDSTALKSALSEASAAALAKVAQMNYNEAQIGHVRYPLPPLVFGAVTENADQARARGESLLNRFEPNGAVIYRPVAGAIDYGRTHWSRQANGLAAQAVESLLESAAFSGDQTLLNIGIHHLRAMNKFRNSVPRGAQTWEIPLHTPDILASAHLVRAYTLGYELTGDSALLEQARYWAWTGVPFIYLTSPTPGRVGPYSTIPVLGATGWVAPVWIGQPVQWCGLVYADALYRLLPHDSDGPWQQLADGITAAGMQHTWPFSDPARKGLLPDFYHLRTQRSDGPAINPGTLLVNALRLQGRPPAYTFRALNRHGLLVHVPGAITQVAEQADRVAFDVATWPATPARLLVNGFKSTPKVRINGQPVSLDDPHQFQAAQGRLILYLEGPAKIELETR